MEIENIPNNNYISFLIIGHGGFLTQFDEETNNTELINCQFSTNINLNIGTFATPSESCVFPVDEMFNFRDKVIEYSNDISLTDENYGATFQHLIQQAELDSKGIRYISDEWSGFFS